MPAATDQFLTCTAPKSGVYTSTECTDNEFCYFHTHKIYPSKFYQGRCCPKLNQTSLVNFAVCPMTVPIKQGCEFCNYKEECSENFGWSNVPVSCCPNPCPSMRRNTVSIEYKCYVRVLPGQECITDVHCSDKHSYCNDSTKTCQCEEDYVYDEGWMACRKIN
uniref:EB domain-containing protein n=1 Tax=Romanomermis culicivorax TaxID=13658 RepID=A0A915KBL6_ROMCU